jgi:MFS transporter, SHS family, sialic acid transporter
MISGFFGAAANLGLILLAVIVYFESISVTHWRWVFLVSACPALLGVLVLALMPESPDWLAHREQVARGNSGREGIVYELLQPPLLRYTIIGILLGAVPLMGNWGSANWLVPWANQAQEQAGVQGLSAATQWAKSSGAVVGSLFGGWLACLCGRRFAYFIISLASLASSFYIFHNLSPLDDGFLAWVFVQGLVGTVYFGWLPLYLPELFPTRVRSTGIGVAFNWGRILTAGGVLWGGQLMISVGGDYARVGRITCLVYVIGMIVICFAPNTSRSQLNEPLPDLSKPSEKDDVALE